MLILESRGVWHVHVAHISLSEIDVLDLFSAQHQPPKSKAFIVANWLNTLPHPIVKCEVAGSNRREEREQDEGEEDARKLGEDIQPIEPKKRGTIGRWRPDGSRNGEATDGTDLRVYVLGDV